MKNPTSPKSNGFSLIVTVTMLVLLSLIAVGLLSLSSTTLRSASNEASLQEARSNARLAMQLAIARLQETMGSDRAVAAPAGTVLNSAAQPHLLGAWESWSWDPVTERGNPDYAREKNSRFRGWLASQQVSGESTPDVSYAESMPARDFVPLLDEGTFGSQGNQNPVVGELVPLSNGENVSGNFAWAVLSEDTKARVNLGRDSERPDDGEHLASGLTFPESFHRESLEIQGLDFQDEELAQRLISNKTVEVASSGGGSSVAARSQFFDFTTHSKGVLSDVANGGLKRDLTTILEEELLNGQRVYSGGNEPFGVADPHWSYLADYYNQYLEFGNQGSIAPINVTRNLGYERPNFTDSSPERLTLRPVLAKLQIVFSMVTQPLNVKDRHNLAPKYNQLDRRFANQHLRAWLAFDPVVTLWNPYSVPIEFSSLSIGLDKIPVALRFAKEVGGNQFDLRNIERQNGLNNRTFWPLSHFVHGGNKQNAISNFTFNIRGGNMTDGISREPVVLEPGENKVFSLFVKEGQAWGRVIDDFVIQGSEQVGAANGRSLVKEVDLVEGLNWVGGFRFDHLARNKNNRNPRSLYSFERQSTNPGTWHTCSLRPTDSIVVKARLSDNDARTDSEDERENQFTMLVEMDSFGEVSGERIEGGSFTVRDRSKLYEDDSDEVIERSFNAAELRQDIRDSDRGGKTPFAVFTMTAKSTNDLLSPTKGWLFGNPVLASYRQDEDEAPQPLQSYEFSFRETSSFNEFPTVELDPNTNRGYFGSGQSAERGLTASPMFALPTKPMVSVGQFQAANLISAVRPPFFNYPLGNSFAHPLLPSNQAVAGTFVDHSYLLNQRLWDSFYFSGLSRQGEANNRESLDRFFDGDHTLVPRLQLHLGQGQNPDEVIAKLSSDPDTASREIAAYQMLEGPFNVHSMSVKAWKSLLLSAYEIEVPTRDGDRHEVQGGAAFSRFLPSYSENLGDLERAAGAGDVGNDALDRARRWLGYHTMSEEQAELLAEKIVEHVKLRCVADEGPFLSLAEFVNRKIGASREDYTSRGVLQTAIDEANDPSRSSEQPGEGEMGELFSLEDGVGIVDIDPRIANPEPLRGNTAEGSPATLLQGDILQHLGAILTVRSDTFRIRTYGSKVARNGAIEAEAWCEAIVQRVPEFLDSGQSPGTPFSELNTVNENFGRRLRVVSFRWLTAEEV